MDYSETKEAIEKLLDGFSYEQITTMLHQIEQGVRKNSIFNNLPPTAS